MDSTNKNVEYSTPEELCEAIRADIDTYDGILIGFGTELFRQKNTDIDEVLNNLAGYLEHKNYFIISSVKDDVLRRTEINQKRIVCPYLAEVGSEPDNNAGKEAVKDEESTENGDNSISGDKSIIDENKQWELYNKWLSGTLAKKLLVIELGEGFNNPNLIKWPFERIVMINEKAHFYRIHSMFYQIAPELKEKSVTYKADSYEILKMLVNIVK